VTHPLVNVANLPLSPAGAFFGAKTSPNGDFYLFIFQSDEYLVFFEFFSHQFF